MSQERENTTLTGSRLEHRSEPTLARAEILYGLGQVWRGEFRPHAAREVELGVGAFPQQEITQTLLTAGADQEIDVARLADAVIDVREKLRELRSVHIPIAAGFQRKLPGRAHDCVARRIVDGDPQIECASGARRLLRIHDSPQKLGGNTVTAADDLHSHAVRYASRD